MVPQGYQQKNVHVTYIGSVAWCSEHSEVCCAVEMSLSQEQRVFFIVEHYFSSLSYARVVNEFRERYPGDKVPNNSTITRLIARFRETGSVADKKKTKFRVVLLGKTTCLLCNELHSAQNTVRLNQYKSRARSFVDTPVAPSCYSRWN